jgi:hypothetical protein
MNLESTRRAQKCTHSLVDLDLEVIARGIFAIDCEEACPIRGPDTICMDFEEVLL